MPAAATVTCRERPSSSQALQPGSAAGVRGERCGGPAVGALSPEQEAWTPATPTRPPQIAAVVTHMGAPQ
jgi:hypothetical protein